MRSLLVFLLVVATIAGAIWAQALTSGTGLPPEGPDRWTVAAYPECEARERLAGRAAPVARGLERAVAGSLGQPGPRARGLFLTSALHAIFVLSALTVALPALGGAIALGLCRREAARTLVKFSSPTYAFGAKKLALASLAGVAVFALSPLAVPYWTVYAAFGAMAIGVAVYLENIPVKI